MSSRNKHRSLIVPDLTAGGYEIRFEAGGYYTKGFDIDVVPTEATTFSEGLVPKPRGEILLDSPETVLPSEMYLEEPAVFSFYTLNSGATDAEYSIRVQFVSVSDPDNLIFTFPEEDADLTWSSGIPAGAHTVMAYTTVTLPEDAIPEGKEEAEYDIYVQLLARS